MPDFTASTEHKAAFEKHLSRLNSEQMRAVKQTEGPAMVIAGPGTGKTQLLSARIGYILQLDTQVNPANILCLTFTESGALQMKNRLHQLIGPEAAQIQIGTFHSFCNGLIQQHPEFFPFRLRQVAEDLDLVNLLKELIDGLPAGHALRNPKDPYGNLKRMLNLFTLMEEENWTAEHVVRAADEFLEDLPNREEYVYKGNYKGHKKGELKPAKVQEAQYRMNQLKAAAAIFDPYLEKKHEKGLYSFGDMIREVLQAFQSKPEFLSLLQEQYHYILVDEYQDTNGAQNSVIFDMCTYWGRESNVFVVGDDDQGIFRFQGANTHNMLDFMKRFVAGEPERVVVMTRNYRSGQAILDAAEQLVSHNQSRLIHGGVVPGLSKDLEAALPQAKNWTRPPQVLHFLNQEQELAWLCAELERKHKEGVLWPEMAVLYTKNAIGDELIPVLAARGIPFTVTKELNALEQPPVRGMLHILHFLCTPKQQAQELTTVLFKVLMHPALDVSPETLESVCLALTAFNSDRRKQGLKALGLDQVLSPTGIAQLDPFLNTMTLRPEAASLDTLYKAFQVLQQLKKEMREKGPAEIIHHILDKTGWLAYITRHQDSAHYLNALSTVIQKISDVLKKNPAWELEDVYGYLQAHNEHGISVPVRRVLGGQEGVQLSTVYKAKGLEYDEVFMIRCTKDKWESTRSSPNKFTLPDTLMDQSVPQESMEEKRRLFYVGMTRARKGLYISVPQRDAAGKEVEASVLVKDLEAGGKVAVYAPEQVPGQVSESEVQALVLQKLKPGLDRAVVHQGLEKAVREMVQGRKLSASAYLKYLECPRAFYYEQLIGLPFLERIPTAFGTVMHELLYRCCTRYNEDGKWPSADRLRSLAHDQLHEYSYVFRDHLETMAQTAEALISGFIKSYTGRIGADTLCEKSLSTLCGPVPIRGILDRMDRSPDGLHIVDYKVMNLKNSSKLKKYLKSPEEGDSDQGRYFRQGAFYVLLAQGQPEFKGQPISMEFLCMDSTNAVEMELHHLRIQPEQLEMVQSEIQTVWKGIQELDFERACGTKFCSWCGGDFQEE